MRGGALLVGVLGLVGCSNGVRVQRAVTAAEAARFTGQVDVLAVGYGAARRDVSPGAEVEKVSVVRVEVDGHESEAGVRYRLRTASGELVPLDVRTPVLVRGTFHDGDEVPGGGVVRHRESTALTVAGGVLLAGVPISLGAMAICLGQRKQPGTWVDLTDTWCIAGGVIGASFSGVLGGILLGTGLYGTRKVEGAPSVAFVPLAGPGFGGAGVAARF